MVNGKRLVGWAMILGIAFGGPACAPSSDDAPDATEDELRLGAVSVASVDAARRSNDPAKIAKVLHDLASDRARVPTNDSAIRIERMRQLFAGLSVELVSAVRAAYISAQKQDPELTIRSDGLAQALFQLSSADELEMVGALVQAKMDADAASLAAMADRASTAALTAADREAYFAMLPRIGLWDAPVRVAAGDRSHDALELRLLERAWTARGLRDLGAALRRIEAKLPPPVVSPTSDRSRSIAVVASSHGAQWQELMGWAVPMHARGYHLQIFTPEGRPVAFQRDSLSVLSSPIGLGFGCPTDLDPAGAAGAVAAELLATTAPAAMFDGSQFGAVYLAGGLGFNEDVAVGRDGVRPDGSKGTLLTANANVAKLMQGAIAEGLPIVAVCHGPTLFAATPIVVDGRSEALNAGIETASLPPFESFVKITRRKEVQFTYDVNTHEVLAEAGGRTNVLADVANLARVVKGRKAEIDIVSGAGPQAASVLADATAEAMRAKWGR